MILVITLSLLVIYIIGFLMVYIFQEQFIFLDDDLAQDYTYQFEAPFEEVNLESGKASLNGLYFPADSPKGAIIYFHGNRGNLTRWGEVVQPFVEMGFAVLVMDYRGYGKSTGKRTKDNLYADARLWYDWLNERFDEPDIVIYGRSIGTGIASWLTSKTNPRQLLLETPYYSLADMARRYYPIYPAKYALRFNFQSHKYLQQVEAPISIFHGTDDSVVPYSQGVKLYKVLNTNTADFYTIEGGAHNNLIEFEDFKEALRQALFF